MTQLGFESSLPFIILLYTQQMVGTAQVQSGEDNGSLKRDKGRISERQGLLVLDCDVIESLHGLKVPSFFPTKKNPAPTGEDEGQMKPAAKESCIYFSMVCRSEWERLYSLLVGSGALGRSSTAQS